MRLSKSIKTEFKRQSYDVRGWCKQYCDKHWHDETINWNVSSTDDLFNELENSLYYNPISPGLLRFLANKIGDMCLINSVKYYEEMISCKNIEDMNFIRETKVIGVSNGESTLIVNALLGNKVTIGKLWNICTPRITTSTSTINKVLTLDASKSLLEFYYSVKVCSFIFIYIYIYIYIYIS